jgi:hypothetical protein
MRGSFLKGAAVGLVCAVLGGATVALAGSGINGVFNLGVSNSINGQTKLTGSTSAAQLRVDNTGAASNASGIAVTSASTVAPALVANNGVGAPAASFSANAGVAPFTVNSTKKVTNLNADMVDGLHVNQIMSGGGRVAQASQLSLMTIASTDTRATVTLVAPNNGFVLLQGTVIFWDLFSICGSCEAAVRVHDVSANVDSPTAYAHLAGSNGTATTIPVQWVFPVTAGTHQYTLTTGQFAGIGGPADFFNPVLTAEYVPFGYNGTSTLAAEGENTVSTSPVTAPTGRASHKG